MERAMLACVVSGFLPLTTYSTIAMAARVSPAVLLLAIVFILAVFVLLRLYWRRRSSFWVGAPAYASIAGHFGTAVVTFLIKLRPVAGSGLSIAFLTSSCGFGICLRRVIVSDPGRVDGNWLDREDPYQRGKYCQYCCSLIQRYDHHCAAVQNCIGRKNHGLFLLMLAMAILPEVLFLGCCYSYVKDVIRVSSDSGRVDEDGTFFNGVLFMAWEAFSQEAWLLSITLFVGVQVTWQVPFLAFQLYLIAINLSMHEWVRWQEIPNFYKEVAVPGSPYQSKIFVNPHDEGLVRNFRAMLQWWS